MIANQIWSWQKTNGARGGITRTSLTASVTFELWAVRTKGVAQKLATMLSEFWSWYTAIVAGRAPLNIFIRGGGYQNWRERIQGTHARGLS